MIRPGRGRLLCALGIGLASAPTLALVSELTLAQQVSTTQGGSQPGTLELAVSVTDPIGRPVTDLRKDDFRVTENSQQQTITSFSGAEVAVSYALIVDTTGSMRKQLPLVLQAAIAVVNSQKSADRAFVIRVNNATYQLALNWTQDRVTLSKAIETFTGAKGQTPLIDALYSSCEYFGSDRISASGREHKRAVVVISDLRDVASRHKPEELLRFLRTTGVEVHALSIREEDPEGRKWVFGNGGELAFKKLTRETGGIALFPAPTQFDVINAASGILPSCRFRYLIRCSASASGGRGVTLNPQVKLVGEAAHKKYSVVTKPLETN